MSCKIIVIKSIFSMKGSIREETRVEIGNEEIYYRSKLLLVCQPASFNFSHQEKKRYSNFSLLSKMRSTKTHERWAKKVKKANTKKKHKSFIRSFHALFSSYMKLFYTFEIFSVQRTSSRHLFFKRNVHRTFYDFENCKRFMWCFLDVFFP